MRRLASAFLLALSGYCTACAHPHPHGTLPQAGVQRILRSRFDLYRGCYEDGLRRNPSLQGRVAVHFVIETDGSVSRTDDRGSDLPDREVVACVARAIGSLHFAQPTGGVVEVVYPIVFNPG